MQYRQLGRSGLFLTGLSLGTMTFGDDRSKGATPKEAQKIIDRYLDAGGNHLDTANVYNAGKSEEIVGQALKGKRHNVTIATKVNFPEGEGYNDRGLSRHNIIRTVENSLRRLQTDYIDLLYMHCQDTTTPIEESLRAFDDLVRSGKVRYIGASNFMAWRLMKALSTSDGLGYERFVAAQYQYSLVKRDVEYEYISLFQEEGLGLLPWGPLGGGFLSGKYRKGQRPTEKDGRIGAHPDHTEEAWQRRDTEQNWDIIDAVGGIAEAHEATYAQVALAWARQRPTVTSVIIGARTLEQLEDNLKAAELQLSEEELDRLNGVSEPAELYPYRFLGEYEQKR
ncbi:MAG: aldo/keto reductase [Lewinellaceae bacterium]|nr:aldo/keto reductase [Phaeodactylibacter sp.]MCB9346087.1 aldo/keto reductase [Lewinellaceae bacterium]